MPNHEDSEFSSADDAHTDAHTQSVNAHSHAHTQSVNTHTEAHKQSVNAHNEVQPRSSAPPNALRRIYREWHEIQADTTNTRWYAEPIDLSEPFEWHFTITGPEDSSFERGIYHGRIVLPVNYPMGPPNIYFQTNNGRFETNRQVCLTATSFHPEFWQPAWGIGSILEALRAFLPSPADGAVHALDWSDAVRRELAEESGNYKCTVCNKTNKEIIQARHGNGERRQGDGERHEGDVERHGEKTAEEASVRPRRRSSNEDMRRHEGDGKRHEGDGKRHEGDGKRHEGDGKRHGGDEADEARAREYARRSAMCCAEASESKENFWWGAFVFYLVYFLIQDLELRHRLSSRRLWLYVSVSCLCLLVFAFTFGMIKEAVFLHALPITAKLQQKHEDVYILSTAEKVEEFDVAPILKRFFRP